MDRVLGFKTAQTMIKDACNKLNVSFVAIIESYNAVTGRARIIPKIKFKNNLGKYQDYASIIECPVASFKTKSFYIRSPYKAGDIVVVVCSQDALDDLLMSSSTTINTLDGVSKHRMQDAIIIGGIFVDDENQMTGEYEDDFVLQNRANGDVIVLKKNGGIEVNTTTEINIKADSMINITSPDTNITGNLTVSGAIHGGVVETDAGIALDKHTHSYKKPAHDAVLANTGPSQ